MDLGFGRGKGVVALDIGSSSIKLAELKETKKGYQLAAFGVQSLPPEVIVEGAVMNAGAIVDGVQTLMAENKVKTKDVATSISGHSVIIKPITIPAQTEGELEESIQWEAEQYVPYDINDVFLDFQIVNPGDEEGNMEVLLVAAKKDMVNDYTAVIQESGLNPVIMDIDAFTLENMYEINYPLREGEILALINVGASYININVTKSGTSIFTRDVSAGGNQFTEEIQKQLGVSYEEAENLKIGGTAGADTEEVMRHEVQDVIRTVSDSLAGEIQRSLDFFAATSAEDQISKICLCGGTSSISTLATAIQERNGLPTECLNPFANITVPEKHFDAATLSALAPQAGVAIGLAMRRVGDK